MEAETTVKENNKGSVVVSWTGGKDGRFACRHGPCFIKAGHPGVHKLSDEKYGHENNKEVTLETINKKLDYINASLIFYVVLSSVLFVTILVLLIYIILHTTP